MHYVRWIAKFLGLGAAAFWGSDVLAHLAGMSMPYGNPVFLLTVANPTVTFVAHHVATRSTPFRRGRAYAALVMLLGVWFFGPLVMAAEFQLMGGTMLQPENLKEFLRIWLLFPAGTFVMSTYSGSLGAVIVVTLGLVGLSMWHFIRPTPNPALNTDAKPSASAG